MTTRRDFFGMLGAGAVLPAILPPFPTNASLPPLAATDYDMSWIDRITMPHKVVFDAPSVDDGGAIWRAELLRREYAQVFGTFPDQISTVVVIRHHGIAMGMAHAFWEKEGVGEKTDTKDADGKWVTRNPVGPVADDARPGAEAFTIPGFIASGGIVLGCDLAFNNMVVGKYRTEGMSRADARELALKDLLPGVILQPSGFFATVRAQQAGCAAFFNG